MHRRKRCGTAAAARLASRIEPLELTDPARIMVGAPSVEFRPTVDTGMMALVEMQLDRAIVNRHNLLDHDLRFTDDNRRFARAMGTYFDDRSYPGFGKSRYVAA